MPIEKYFQHFTCQKIFFLQSIILIAVTSLIYSNSTKGNFIFDDFSNIVDVSSMKAKELSFESISSAMFHHESPSTPRPISRLSFYLNSYFFGLESAFSFKVLNLIIHLLNGLLLLKITKYLFITLKIPCSESENAIFSLPFFVSLLWLLHPINVSAVSYAVQRMTLLATLFTFIGLYYYLIAKLSYRSNKKYRITLLVLVPLFTLLGVLSKENAILLIAYCALIEFLSPDIDLKKSFDAYKGFFLFYFFIPTIIAILFITFAFENLTSSYLSRDFTLQERLLTQPRALLFYVQQILFPINSQFSLFHDDFITSRNIASPISTLLSILLLVATIIFAFSYRKKYPLASFSVLFFLIGHIIESTFIPLEMIFEHRNYTPSVSIILLIVFLFFRSRKLINVKVSQTSLSLYTAYIAFVTFLQANIWSNTLLHKETMYRYNPDSFRANYEMAIEYAKFVAQENDKFHQISSKLATRSLELDANKISPLIILLNFKLIFNQERDKYLVNELRSRLSKRPISPADAISVFRLSLAPKQISPFISSQELHSVVEAAIKNPLKTEKTAAQLWFSKANLHLAADDTVKAIDAFERGLELLPSHEQAREILITLLVKHGRINEAELHFSRLSNFYPSEKLKEMIHVAKETSSKLDRK